MVLLLSQERVSVKCCACVQTFIAPPYGIHAYPSEQHIRPCVRADAFDKAAVPVAQKRGRSGEAAMTHSGRCRSGSVPRRRVGATRRDPSWAGVRVVTSLRVVGAHREKQVSESGARIGTATTIQSKQKGHAVCVYAYSGRVVCGNCYGIIWKICGYSKRIAKSEA
jgi:hypothetical protein